MRNKLYLLGTSTRGASMLPTLVKSERDVIKHFGDTGSLIDGYRKLSDSDMDFDIYLVKPNGAHAVAYFHLLTESGEVLHNSIEIRATESVDNEEITVKIHDEKLSIVSNTATIEYPFSEFKTIFELVRAIKSDAIKKISPVTAFDYSMTSHSLAIRSLVSTNRAVTRLSSGRSGIDDNKNTLYHSIEATLDTLIGETVDTIVLADCFIDDTRLWNDEEVLDKPYELLDVYTNDMLRVYMGESMYSLDSSKVYVSNPKPTTKKDELCKEFLPDGSQKILSFYALLLRFSTYQMIAGVITKSILGFRAINSDKPIDRNYYKEYQSFIDRYKDNPLYVETMSLVSVTVGDVYYDSGSVIDNMVYAYASSISSNNYLTNIENKELSSQIKYRVKFDKDFIKEFKCFIYTRYSPLTKNLHVLNAITTSTLKVSRYEYVIRTLQLLYKELYPALSDRLGETLTDENIDSFSTLVDETLSRLISKTMCSKYNYSLETRINGDTIINCNIFFPKFLSPFKLILNLNGGTETC